MWAPVVAAIALVAPASSVPAASPPAERITILYDAFGKRTGLRRDWGFAALIEYRGRRILFDTGNNAEVFEHNIRALDVDLRRLDFVVVSHRHGDHTSGLGYVLRVNPTVRIYAPREGFGVFGNATPYGFLRPDSTLPAEERYFNATGSFMTTLRPQSFRLFLVTGQPGVVWTNSSYRVETVDGELRIAVNGPAGTDGFIEIYAPQFRSVFFDDVRFPIARLRRGLSAEAAYDQTTQVLRIPYTHDGEHHIWITMRRNATSG